jgi:hypothetical protein
MSMYPRLLGIAAVVFGFGLSEALPADDVWKGSWKGSATNLRGPCPHLNPGHCIRMIVYADQRVQGKTAAKANLRWPAGLALFPPGWQQLHCPGGQSGLQAMLRSYTITRS